MKKFNEVCAQGDIYIRKIAALPKGTVEVPRENGKLIVTHSETGHHHVMEGEAVTLRRLPDSIMDCFVVVGGEGGTLEHLRPNDTHETIKFEPGVYHVRRQREYTPEGWRRVED
ncbi:MAG: hypothetical protein J0H39_13825 [Alphaproteobacteria bacterium]|nr:hypothetical protein [Alphaproteobacteria bacterium]